MPEEMRHSAQAEEPFLEINTSEEEGGGTPTLVFVVTIILLVLVTGFFVFYKTRTDSQVKDKQQALNGVLDQLNSTSNKTIETKADNLNSAVQIISTASKTKYSFKGFVDELTKKITNDTKLNSVAVTDTGVVTFDGISGSFRSVADLALALKSSPKLTNVEIIGLTRSTNSGEAQVAFSMSAEIKDWKVDSPSDSTTDTAPADSIGGVSE